MSTITPDRRGFVLGGAGALVVQLVPIPLRAEPEDLERAVRESLPGKTYQEGRVTLKIPVLSENGNSVPLDVEVDSPMTDEDHVTSIQIFSPENPLPNIAKFYLGPRAGRARVATRIRLADSQRVLALAEMSDGTLWAGYAKVIVTIAACIDLG